MAVLRSVVYNKPICVLMKWYVYPGDCVFDGVVAVAAGITLLACQFAAEAVVCRSAVAALAHGVRQQSFAAQSASCIMHSAKSHTNPATRTDKQLKHVCPTQGS